MIRTRTVFCKVLLALVISLVSFTAYAQSGDKLYAAGVKCQQTLTIASQNRAISYFKKAKVAYDSQTRKNICDEQIKACRNIIARLSAGSKKPRTTQGRSRKAKKPKKNTTTKAPVEEEAAVDSVAEKPEVQLTVTPSYIKLKGKGGTATVRVDCNYDTWAIEDAPEWVTCAKNGDNKIDITVGKNTEKSERSGDIKISCEDKSVTLVIIQEKNKLLGIF